LSNIQGALEQECQGQGHVSVPAVPYQVVALEQQTALGTHGWPAGPITAKSIVKKTLS